MILAVFKRFLGMRQPDAAEDQSAEEKVERIQQGDHELLNQMIIDYQPFVAKTAGRFRKRYIDPSRDDEFAIALQAFREAIEQFSPASGRSFLSFAETVIRRRLIDYVRKEERHRGNIPMTAFEFEDEEDNAVNPVEIHQAIEAYERQRTIEDRQAEIRDYDQKLREFGITFSELASVGPKHEDSRAALLEMGKQLAEDAELMSILLEKKTLPIKGLLEQVGVSRKTLERNRKYLIAVALLHYGEYPYLQDYLHTSNSSGQKR